MTKKHFVALADMIKEFNATRIYDSDYTLFATDQIQALAGFCARQNPRFNRERWIAYIKGECGSNGGKVKRQAVTA